MIQGAFEAGQFPDQGVVPGIGVSALPEQQPVELNFRLNQPEWHVPGNQSGTGQAPGAPSVQTELLKLEQQI